MTRTRVTSSSAPARSARHSRALLRRGETSGWSTAPAPPEYRMTSRSSVATPPTHAFTTEVTRGARVVYQTLNPPYERWAEKFPALQAGVLAAAEATEPGW